MADAEHGGCLPLSLYDVHFEALCQTALAPTSLRQRCPVHISPFIHPEDVRETAEPPRLSHVDLSPKQLARTPLRHGRLVATVLPVKRDAAHGADSLPLKFRRVRKRAADPRQWEMHAS